MRLAYLIGYGIEIEKSPVNSASLSMLPWPKPATWPSIPPDSSAEIMAKEKVSIFQLFFMASNSISCGWFFIFKSHLSYIFGPYLSQLMRSACLKQVTKPCFPSL
uniref:Uncharacterized protein n=1 Tax=Arundo donax TaxID=35708 RepID=A0A0A9D8R6_ARUDO